jgi:hypothetical protein
MLGNKYHVASKEEKHISISNLELYRGSSSTYYVYIAML